MDSCGRVSWRGHFRVTSKPECGRSPDVVLAMAGDSRPKKVGRTFESAVMGFESGGPERCPEHSSYTLDVAVNPEPRRLYV
jgi:hypothetical protein